MSDPRPPLRIETLTTSRLTLTPLDPAADARDLHVMYVDPEVHRYDIDAWVSESVAETESRLRLQVVANGGATWGIRLADGPSIGTIGVFADQGTTIRGVGWSLASSYWRQGITSEAARTVVPFLLSQPGVDGLEAWVDSRNLASIGVARAAGMTLGARLPRVYPDHVAQTIVMVRSAAPVDPEVFGTSPVLTVSDLPGTLELMQTLLRLHVAWAMPDPPTVAYLSVEPWSGSLGLQLVASDQPIMPRELSLDIGISVDEVRARVDRAGLAVVDEPVDQPWYRREMSFRLGDGHLIRLSGPSTPRHARD